MKKMKSIQLTLLAGLTMVVLSFGSGLTGCGNDGDDTDVAVFSPRDYACATDTTTPCETTVPESEASRTREIVNEYSTPQTFTYVISEFTFPRSTTPSLGFNLDGIDSGDGTTESGSACNLVSSDYNSATDPDHIGVDNAFAFLLPTWEAVFGLLDEINFYLIQDGTQLIFIQVSGVDSLVNDPEVQVQLFYGDPGQTPELTSGSITPGQSFDATISLSATGNASILDGRLAINNFNAEIPIALGSYPDGESLIVPSPLRFRTPAFRFDISETELSNAAIGGAFLSSELVNWLISAGVPTDQAEEFIYPNSDIQASAIDPTQCERVSIGLGFSAVSAELN